MLGLYRQWNFRIKFVLSSSIKQVHTEQCLLGWLKLLMNPIFVTNHGWKSAWVRRNNILQVRNSEFPRKGRSWWRWLLDFWQVGTSSRKAVTSNCWFHANSNCRTTGLLRTKAIKYEDRPIWYDVYRVFPPKFEPRADRQPELSEGMADEVPSILYNEDVSRA